MADGILAAVNENGNIDRFIDTKGGVHYIEPKRYEESVAKIDAAATKAKETVNSATEAVSECKAQTGACTQETARAKEIADTVESRITGIEGDVAALRDSVSQDTGVILLAGNNPGPYDTNGVRYIVRHGICYLSVCCGGTWNVGSIGTTAKQIAILPEGARPVLSVECWSRKPGGGDTTMYVQADGKIMAMSSSDTTYFRGYAVFPVA